MAYIQAILAQLIEEDGLAVLGEGLGLSRLLAASARLHASQRGGLVLLLGCSDWQKRAVAQELEAAPRDVTADMSVAERLAGYSAGGCLFVTTRILVVDLLSQRLPASSVTGLIVVNAHRVSATSGEAFAVRLLRGSGNAGAFVRALSDRPGELSRGFSAAEAVLKALLLRNVYLWPRFHLSVRDALEAAPPEVVEFRQPLSRSMRLIQEALLEVMGACLVELRRSRLVDTSELTVEDGLFRSFDRVLSRQLEPVWHTAPRRLRQAVADLRTLRNLAQCLMRYDAVTFLRHLENLRASEARDSLWLFADSTHTIFEQAKRRVFAVVQPAADKPEAAAADGEPATLHPVLEPLPKWTLLSTTVAEIRGEQACMLEAAGSPPPDAEGEAHAQLLRIEAEAPILVVARDSASARQLSLVLANGADCIMRELWATYVKQRSRPQSAPQTAVRKRGKGVAVRAKKKRVMATDAPPPFPGPGAQPAAGRPSRDELAGFQRAVEQSAPDAGRADEEHVSVQPAVVNGIAVASLDAREGLLSHFSPKFIVLYEPDQAFIREVEVYNADRPGLRCTLYILMHDTSVDEQRYESAVSRERESFQSLIQVRQRLAAPHEQDGRAIAAAIASGGPALQGSIDTAVVSARKAGGRAAAAGTAVVVVDIREFMSHLPCVLHSAGFTLAPVTLDVGDYILSPELCVERKSLPDLVGSLASGRLFHQAEAMCRHYATPALLIEFDTDKHFGLVSPGDIGEDVSPKALGSKLVLLLLHFPKLRVLWSRSIHATTNLFASLKANGDQPDVVAAAAVGAPSEEGSEELTNQAALDLLRRLPGVNDRTALSLMRRFGSLAGVAACSEAALVDALGDRLLGSKLHAFLQAPFPANA